MTLSDEATTILNTRLRHLLSSTKSPASTICPSQVPRALSTQELAIVLGHPSGDWRQLMDATRDIVYEMRERGELEILQRGVVVEAEREDIRGPIRIRWKA
ncbi:hypothetical protein FRB95_001407 [Tulasnella sp. JGI-2019a]|nr:hypothetical protein FRB93_003664 [Tulasnella sp. JGI-2019a]KAG9032500.1 hypothetical protein FRB95_001407 [Tulasnella sp. JGI-2019a]